MEAMSSDVVSNTASCMCIFSNNDMHSNYPLAFLQVLRLPVNLTSSNVKTVAVPSSFGAAMETTTVTITPMKQTAVSPFIFALSVSEPEVKLMFMSD